MPGLAAVAGFAALAITLPHLLPPARFSAPLSAAVWMLALILRALATASIALLALAYIPHTAAFEDLAARCWHAVVPVVTLQFELRGHDVADTAAILPPLALVLSALVALARFGRAGWKLRRRLAARTLGWGPLGSRVVEEDGVLIALTALGRPEIVVSRAALEKLDRDELDASLCHERAHLERRHRPILLLARLLGAVARPLPGSRAAERQLALSLERDADEQAVRSTGDPLALASAICKAAGVRSPEMTLALSGNHAVLARLDALLEPQRAARPTLVIALAGAQAVVAAAIVVFLGAWLLGSPAGAQAVAHLASLCAS